MEKQEPALARFKFIFEKPLSVVALIDDMILRADSVNASDIHIDPRVSDVRMRFRIDGILHDVCFMPRDTYAEFVARIKIVAGLRIDERIVPQDGRFSLGDSLDIRVTTIASYYGESVVMRLLRREVKANTLRDLGFSLFDEEKIANVLNVRQGLVLVTGPTGSGKTTTLYALLALVADFSISTVTLEDPIEYAIQNARQIQVQQKRGINFANGLRSILRQDPDVIMVGEMRDHETAAIAANAALTGHLVLSTLHTNDAVSTLVRIVEMGVEPYLVAATLRLVINQRLVRKLCLACKIKTKIDPKELSVIKKYLVDYDALGNSDDEVYLPKGCDSCAGTGYRGRTVIAEILPITEELSGMIVEKKSITQIKSAAFCAGMRPFGAQAVSKLFDGLTSFEEIVKILYE